MVQAGHVLVLVDDTDAGREAATIARRLVEAAGGRLTAVVVALREDERSGCCDLRSGVWNRLQREIADEHARAARTVVGERATIEVVAGRRVSEAVADEAIRRRCDLVIVPETGGLRWPWRKSLVDQLRRRSCRAITPSELRSSLRSALSALR